MSESIIAWLYNWLLESGAFVRWCILGWLAAALFHVANQGTKFVLWLIEKLAN